MRGFLFGTPRISANSVAGDNPVVLSAIVDFKIDGYVLPGFGANDGLARQPKG
jgi:hypothetical protein